MVTLGCRKCSLSWMRRILSPDERGGGAGTAKLVLPMTWAAPSFCPVSVFVFVLDCVVFASAAEGTDKRNKKTKFVNQSQTKWRSLQCFVCLPVVRFWIIFSSIKALTLTDAVCRGGPTTSFFSVFLFSASWNKQNQWFDCFDEFWSD